MRVAPFGYALAYLATGVFVVVWGRHAVVPLAATMFVAAAIFTWLGISFWGDP